jgi:hypothetical protein
MKDADDGASHPVVEAFRVVHVDDGSWELELRGIR